MNIYFYSNIKAGGFKVLFQIWEGVLGVSDAIDPSDGITDIDLPQQNHLMSEKNFPKV
jgi:hypothetical protein